MKLARRAAVLGLLVVLASAIVVAMDYRRFLDTEIEVPADGLPFEIPSGSSFSAVADRLAADGVISHPGFFRLHARLEDKAGAIQAGEYLIAADSTPRSLLRQFTSGAVRLYAFTIVEGWNRWELLQAMERHPVLEVSLSDEDWPAFLESLGAETANPEGLFLPETYHFPRGTDDRKLLAEAYAAMQEALLEEWESRSADAIVATPYEALTLASIVEKETARVDERAKIAGVFTRRLERGMRLQTDPTVIYGLQPGFNGNLTRKNLRTDTPYNTYTRGGLPPTPIAMPGRAAINAALNPEPGTALYFVATGLGDGSHTFSDTNEQHNRAVQEYLRRLRKGDGT